MHTLSLSTGKTIQSYVSGQAICTFGNASLVKATTWSAAQPQRRVAIVPHYGDQQQQQQQPPMSADDKYMFDTLLEKSLSASDRLYDIGHQICVKLKLEREAAASAETTAQEAPGANVFDQLVHPDVASQHSITCCGRICSDAEAPIGAGSTLLVSTDDRRVRSVRLHLTQLRSFGLFAGQTVAVCGTNPRGDTLYATAVHTERQLRRAPPPAVAADQPLSVLVVSGPYTADDDLTYEPLHDLLAYACQQRPDVLVMLGPFVEAAHAMVVDGVLQETFEAFFEKIVTEVMEKMG